MERKFKIGAQVGYNYMQDTHLLLQDSYAGHYVRSGGRTPDVKKTIGIRRVDDGSVQIETTITQTYQSGAARETSAGMVIPAEHVPALIEALTKTQPKRGLQS